MIVKTDFSVNIKETFRRVEILCPETCIPFQLPHLPFLLQCFVKEMLDKTISHFTCTGEMYLCQTQGILNNT